MDIAEKVYYEKPVDLTMGAANVIWQGDANAVVLRASCTAKAHRCFLTSQVQKSFRFAGSPHDSVKFSEKHPPLKGVEAETALLSNAARCHQLFGYPRISLEQMVQWVAHWVEIGEMTTWENRQNLKCGMASFEFQNVLLADRHLPRRCEISRCERVKIEATGDKLTQLDCVHPSTLHDSDRCRIPPADAPDLIDVPSHLLRRRL